MNRELEIRERVAQYGMALLGADRVEMDATRDNLEFYAYSDLRYLLDETDHLTADLAAMTAERDAAQRRGEAAERDILLMLKGTSDPDLCVVCGCKDCAESRECKPEWRGPVAENQQGREKGGATGDDVSRL